MLGLRWRCGRSCSSPAHGSGGRAGSSWLRASLNTSSTGSPRSRDIPAPLPRSGTWPGSPRASAHQVPHGAIAVHVEEPAVEVVSGRTHHPQPALDLADDLQSSSSGGVEYTSTSPRVWIARWSYGPRPASKCGSSTDPTGRRRTGRRLAAAGRLVVGRPPGAHEERRGVDGTGHDDSARHRFAPITNSFTGGSAPDRDRCPHVEVGESSAGAS